MIRPDKLEQAIRAVQQVIIRGRTMAYEAESHRRIASLLDDAEYLPGLILAPEDRTEAFSPHLQVIAEEYRCEVHLQSLAATKTHLRRKQGFIYERRHHPCRRFRQTARRTNRKTISRICGSADFGSHDAAL